MKPVVHRGSVRTVDISLFPIWDKFTVRGKVEAEICEGGSQLKPQLLPQLFKSWGQVEAQIGAEVGVGILTLKPPIAVVQEYLGTELAAKRMSGPFDQATTEKILRGPFYCSPLIVACGRSGPGFTSQIPCLSQLIQRRCKVEYRISQQLYLKGRLPDPL
jgi:hypothetical protein